jgi:hypothetical protein
MEVKRDIQTRINFTIELDDVEASILRKTLERINNRPGVNKSEFTLREKRLANALILHLRQHIEPEPVEEETTYDILVSPVGWVCTCGANENTQTGAQAQRHGYNHGLEHKEVCVVRDARVFPCTVTTVTEHIA